MTDARWFSGQSLAIAQADLAIVSEHAEEQSLTIYADQSGEFNDAIEALSVSVSEQTYIVMAQPSGGGLAAYRYDGTALTRTDAQWDKPDSYMSGVASMTSVTMGNQTYIIAAGANDNGIAVLHLSSSGQITPISALGYDEFLPVYTVTSVDTVTSGTATYVVVTASDTSSLTVLELASDGTLTAKDQIIDDRDTRIDGASVMQSFQYEDRAYVLVAGNDDGLSLFTILPDGTLVHVTSFADTNNASLSNVSNIEIARSTKR